MGFPQIDRLRSTQFPIEVMSSFREGEGEDDDFADESLLIHEAVAVTDMISHCQLNGVEMPSSISSLTHQLQFKKSYALTPAEKKSLLNIFVTNMEGLYQQAGWGWDLAKEQKELFHITSRFLYLTDRTKNDEIVGFIMFRFEWDDEDEPEHPVIFVYQLQVESSSQHLGLGSYFMALMEQVSNRCKMWKIMLTCFKENRKAFNFYINKIHYGIDVNSPSRGGYEEETYEILSNKPNLR